MLEMNSDERRERILVGWINRIRPGTRDKMSRQVSDRPAARSEHLVVEELGDELLVYDLQLNRAHSLGDSAARVWRACDGKTMVDSLCAKTDLDADTVARALSELRECR